MSSYQELLDRVLAVITEPGEDTIESVLQTVAALPEPEEPLDAAFRLLIVDMAVKEYLGTCDCKSKHD